MPDNILESYFVKVAALPDGASFLRLGSILRQTEFGINQLTKTSIGSMVAFETASLSTFSAIGAGIISLADKTAMADQGYRLMGLRMLMTKDSARALQTALHELGDVSIDEVAFDPELNKRFQELYEENIKLNKAMGPSFDQNMRSIRDIRVEFMKFGTELEYLTGGVLTQLFDKLGFGSGDFLNRLHQFNDWFSEKLPQISDEVSQYLIEPWDEFKIVAEDAWGDLKLFGQEFQTISGILLGDKSIEEQDVSIKSLIHTMEDWLDEITKVTLGFSLLAKTGLHEVAATVATIAASYELLRGNLGEAREFKGIADKEQNLAINDLSDITKGFVSKTFGTDYSGWQDNPDFAGFKSYAKMKYGNTDQYDMSDFGPNFDKSKLPGQGSSVSNEALARAFVHYGTQFGVDPTLLSAIVKVESGYNPGVTSRTGAKGLMQLMDPTANMLGVKNPYNPEQSIGGGARYISQLLKYYHGDLPKALAAYNEGPGALDSHGGKPYSETQKYVNDVLREYSLFRGEQQKSGGDVVINSVTINVPKSLPEEQWPDFVHRSMSDIIDKNTRNTTAQTAAGAFF